MNKLKVARYAGMIGAVLTGAAMIIGGQVIEGAGVIAAAFASATTIVPAKGE